MTLQPARTLVLGLLFLFCQFTAFSQAPILTPIKSGTTASFRGLSVVNDSVIWLSGTHGTVGRSTDGGKNWQWHHTTSCDSCDWRSIAALNESEAYVLNAGSPASLCYTYDGGYTWTIQYANRDTAVFFDSMVFADSLHGYAIGDPSNEGHFLMLYTENAGHRWFTYDYNDGEFPEALPGEAIFAASNSNLVPAKGQPRFITGGKASRLFTATAIEGKPTPPIGFLNIEWHTQDLPMIKGQSTTGAFAMDFYKDNGIIVGGDYKHDALRTQNCLYTTDGGQNWRPAQTPPFGYRSGVAFVNMNWLAATGTSGTDFSVDGGKNWHNLSKTGYNTVKSLGNGRGAILAGAGGKVALLTFPVTNK